MPGQSLKAVLPHRVGVNQTGDKVHTCTLMMIDSDTLRYYIHRALFLGQAANDIKFFIFNLKESRDE